MIPFRFSKELEENLFSYGFLKVKEEYVLRKEIHNGQFYAVFRIKNQNLEVDVYDNELKEEYLPFYREGFFNPLVSKVKEEVENYIREILLLQRNDENIVPALCRYGEEKYACFVDQPFSDYTYKVLKNKKGKWVALFMELEKDLFQKGDTSLCWVMNVKSNPRETVDFQYVFPAYHKNHWVSVLLDAQKPISFYQKFVDESYAFVWKK